MIVETRPTAGEALQQAVAKFEALFRRVDDAGIHGFESRTAGGTPFKAILLGATYEDHLLCVGDWFAAAVREIGAGHTVLYWRVRPHLVAVPGVEGFTIVSRFATEPE